MPENAVRYRLLISGRVQGVSYRYWTREQATELGLVGWVKNLPDGRVEAVVEGPANAVDNFINLCWEGPRAAEVTEVATTPEVPKGEFSRFEIER